MATGDRICPNCGQWQGHCKCGWASARQRESWFDTAAPISVDWGAKQEYTVFGKPWEPWGTTVTTITTRKPRKRRHYRQVVY